jgi:endonuclease YncB( thermonuclease family)
MSYKDLWFDRYERELNEAEDRGLRGRAAEDAARRAADGFWEDLVDHADNLRKARREQGA